MDHCPAYNWGLPHYDLFPINEELPKNRFIFVNKIGAKQTILINPHFKENTKVFVNPNFSANIKPNIHVNPNVLKISTTNMQNSRQETAPESITLVSTKNKLVKIHSEKRTLQNDTKPKTPRKLIATRTKIVNESLKNCKSIVLVRRNSLVTKYTYIKNDQIIRKMNRSLVKSKHKIINSNNNNNKSSNSSISPRKKYCYINKFNSSTFWINNVVLKNAKRSTLVNVNGILHQNSLRVTKKHLTQRKSNAKNEGYLKQSRISPSKLRKNNMPCQIYKKYGRCRGQKLGTCGKMHNPDQVALCTKFLQGACIKKNCLLSHKISPEKMPTCNYFLEGLCSRDDCQYVHVKISPKADICKNFLEGFCKDGIKCEKRHQFLCPDFEKTQKCAKVKCEYLHETRRLSLSKNVKKIRPEESMRKNPETTEEKTNIRYYEEEMNAVSEVKDTVISRRPQLGSLPHFIPLSG